LPLLLSGTNVEKFYRLLATVEEWLACLIGQGSEGINRAREGAACRGLAFPTWFGVLAVGRMISHLSLTVK